MGKHSGRVVVVTGAAGSLGSVLTEAFQDEGATVVGTDLRSSGLEDPSNSADISIREEAASFLGRVLDAHGHIDVLVNNAGGGIIRAFEDHDQESMEETLRRNLWTTLNMCSLVLPHMRERGSGRIVNIGAESVRNGLNMHAVYNAAKGGIHGLTTGLAREYAGFGITVNTVAPAGIETPRARERRTNGDPDGLLRHAVDLIPLGRLATPLEVADLCVFLASDSAAFITGQVMSVNGGSSML